MPELTRFYGIVIKMFYNDHNPPHFHAEYGDDQVVVDLNTLAVIAGQVPPRATGLVMEWAALHRGELRRAWTQSRNMEPLARIDPLP